MSNSLTSLTYINPTATSGLLYTLTNAEHILSTASANAPLYTASDHLRGATNSLNIISAQQVLSTATDPQVQASATAVIESAIADLEALKWSENMYSEYLTLWPNLTFTIVFGVLFLIHIGLTIWSGYYYFGVVFFCGCGLTFAGYLSRAFSVGNEEQEDPFLCQFICLTISPAFIMAGIYYILGRMLRLHGDNFSMLKPKWFSYIFVSCDLISLIVQAVGGAMAAFAVTDKTSTDDGTNVMVGGIAFQVVSMSLFYLALLEFLFKIYFRNSPEVTFSLRNFFALFFNTKRGSEMRVHLEPNYVAEYQSIRAKKLFPYIPLSLAVATFFIYIRCIYRLVELSGGWTGFVMTHEAFLFSLDALQVTFCCLTMALWHPYFIWGRHGEIKRLDRERSHVEEMDLEKTGSHLENFGSEGDKVLERNSQCSDSDGSQLTAGLIVVEELLGEQLSFQISRQLSRAQSNRAVGQN